MFCGVPKQRDPERWARLKQQHQGGQGTVSVEGAARTKAGRQLHWEQFSLAGTRVVFRKVSEVKIRKES